MADLIMHRTRNLGVVGVNGKYTKGPFYSAGAVTFNAKQGKKKTKGKK